MVREYVGARYVPKFMGTWSVTTAYEALSIVDDGQGTSYTSKVPVPAGTPLTNADYWAVTGSTSGAIVSLQNRVSFLENEYANVKFYGAVGDGVTDDTQAFLDAAATGKSIYIPEGSYLVSDHIQLASNTHLFGHGKIIDNITNVAGDKRGVFTIDNKSNVCIEGITILGQGHSTGAYTPGCEIYVYNSDDIKIKNVTITEVKKAYTICFETSNNIEVEGCYIEKYTQAGISCINVCNNVMIHNNTLIDVTGQTSGNTYPIMLNGYDYAITTPQPVGNNLQAIGNFIDNPTGGAYWEGIDAHGGNNIVIADNVVKNVYVGIGLAGTANFTSKNVEVSNNILDAGNTGNPRAMANHGIACSYVTNGKISDNIIKGFAKLTNASTPLAAGIFVPYSNDITITDNEITDCGQGNGFYGIYIISSQHVDNADNYIHDNSLSAAVRWFGDCDYIYMRNNLLRASGAICEGDTTSTHDPLDIRVWDNDCEYRLENGSRYTPQFANNTTIANVVTGKRSQIIWQSDPLEGVPMGYICKEAASAGTPAVWLPLPAIPS